MVVSKSLTKPRLLTVLQLTKSGFHCTNLRDLRHMTRVKAVFYVSGLEYGGPVSDNKSAGKKEVPITWLGWIG